MKVEIINQEYNILAVGAEFLPDDLKGHILIIYAPSMDAIVISKDNKVFKEIAELVEAYLSLGDWNRKKFMDECSKDVTSKELLDIMRVLDRIIRIRRKLRLCKKK